MLTKKFKCFFVQTLSFLIFYDLDEMHAFSIIYMVEILNNNNNNNK